MADSPSEEAGVKVPVAEYINDVAQYLQGKPADQAIQRIAKNLQVYQLLEQDLHQKKARILYQIPEIEKSLKAVKLLQLKREAGESATFDFSLSEQAYAKATAKNIKTVNLWLGAQVMLEYELDEAKALLDHNVDKAREQLQQLNSELDTLKDFITTSQVNQARLYNHDVTRRRTQKPGE